MHPRLPIQINRKHRSNPKTKTLNAEFLPRLPHPQVTCPFPIETRSEVETMSMKIQTMRYTLRVRQMPAFLETNLSNHQRTIAIPPPNGTNQNPMSSVKHCLHAIRRNLTSIRAQRERHASKYPAIRYTPQNHGENYSQIRIKKFAAHLFGTFLTKDHFAPVRHEILVLEWVKLADAWPRALVAIQKANCFFRQVTYPKQPRDFRSKREPPCLWVTVTFPVRLDRRLIFVSGTLGLRFGARLGTITPRLASNARPRLTRNANGTSDARATSGALTMPANGRRLRRGAASAHSLMNTLIRFMTSKGGRSCPVRLARSR
jgi:hypothetical protein